MAFMKQYHPASMLKDGHTIVDDPVLKNIQACSELTKITASSMGPYGLCKMVINHLGKILVTHDASSILNELEVDHPAAKLLVLAAKSMQEEVGDGTNLVITLAGELLSNAQGLIRMGLHTSDVIAGYMVAGKEALRLLDECTVGNVTDPRQYDSVLPLIKTAIASKQYGYEGILADLVTKACINSCPSNPRNFNVDNVRVAKLDGDAVQNSQLIRGFVIARDTEGTLKHMKSACVAMYGCAIDVPATETKGNVLIENAQQLLEYSKKEEELMETLVAQLTKANVNVCVTNSTIGDLAMHFLEKAGIMVVKVMSKFEMRRLSQAVGARVLATFVAPSVEDLGACDQVDVCEMGGKKVTVFQQECDDSKLSTIVLRGATQNVLDDLERAVDDGVNVYKALTKDGRFVSGGGSCEMALQKELTTIAEGVSGLDQYAMRKFASAFEVVPRILADVSGYNGNDVVTQLQADHNAGKKFSGVSVDDGSTKDMVEAGIVDAHAVKYWAIKLATDTAVTVLSVDQIIVAKQAGGPKFRGPQARDED